MISSSAELGSSSREGSSSPPLGSVAESSSPSGPVVRPRSSSCPGEEGSKPSFERCSRTSLTVGVLVLLREGVATERGPERNSNAGAFGSRGGDSPRGWLTSIRGGSVLPWERVVIAGIFVTEVRVGMDEVGGCW